MGAHIATVLCGPGNNGGDGFVIARLLAERGWGVSVLAPEDSLRAPPDAAANRKQWEKIGEVLPLNRDGLKSANSADLFVDAVFGTGLTRPPEGELAELLSYMAGSGGDHGVSSSRVLSRWMCRRACVRTVVKCLAVLSLPPLRPLLPLRA